MQNSILAQYAARSRGIEIRKRQQMRKIWAARGCGMDSAQYRILAVAIAVWDSRKAGGNQNCISNIIKGNPTSQIFCFSGTCDGSGCLGRCLLKNFSNILTVVHDSPLS